MPPRQSASRRLQWGGQVFARSLGESCEVRVEIAASSCGEVVQVIRELTWVAKASKVERDHVEPAVAWRRPSLEMWATAATSALSRWIEQ